jgi:tight adherence protein B
MGTGLLLGVLSIISVLLALAVWLWGTASSREQRQASLQHAEQQLARGSAAGAVPAGPAVAAANDPARPASSGSRALPWDGVLQRAGLQPGWKLP